MRCIALDVHRDFCEVAVAEGGQVGHKGRIETSTATLKLFAQSLPPGDRVVLEATGPAFAIAIARPHVERGAVVGPLALQPPRPAPLAGALVLPPNGSNASRSRRPNPRGTPALPRGSQLPRVP